MSRAPDRKRQGAVAKGVFLGFFLTEYVLSLRKIRWTFLSNLKGREVAELIVTLISLGYHRRITNHHHHYHNDEEDLTDIFSNYNNFKTKIRRVFGILNEESTVKRIIQ